MGAINADTADAWRDLAAQCSADKPAPGRRVRVVAGKRSGRTGVVTRHMPSRFEHDVYRYASEAQAHLRDMRGREGFVCRLRFDDGSEAWVPARNVEVLP